MQIIISWVMGTYFIALDSPHTRIMVENGKRHVSRYNATGSQRARVRERESETERARQREKER